MTFHARANHLPCVAYWQRVAHVSYLDGDSKRLPWQRTELHMLTSYRRACTMQACCTI
jgi:hypothetical protein